MVLQLDHVTGELLHSWGARTFSMPHMITRDWDGNIWVTGRCSTPPHPTPCTDRMTPAAGQLTSTNHAMRCDAWWPMLLLPP